MNDLLIIEDSNMLCQVFETLVEKYTNFNLTLAKTYAEAQSFLSQKRYEYAIADMNLPDAKEGEIISLLNRHNIAPIVFTGIVDEEFRNSFESAFIVDYVLKERFDNIIYVVEKLKQLQKNKSIKVLIVDDSVLYNAFLKQNLSIHKFQVLTATNGEEALERLEAHPDIELVITDYYMPKMDGLEFVRKARRKFKKNKLAIIALTAETNSYITSKFLKEGANDYITKPFSRDEFYARIYQNLEVTTLFEEIVHKFDDNLLHLFAELTEFKSSETHSHIKRICEYTRILARLSGFYPEEAEVYAKMSILHDIGKITIPDEILHKNAALDEDEFEMIKTHTTRGASLITTAFGNESKACTIAQNIIRYHHEKWDGSGYPEGLAAEKIPIEARIVSLVDVFDALMNKRVYKEKWHIDDAIEYIKNEAEKSFDPKLVQLFLNNLSCFINVLNQYSEENYTTAYCKVQS